MRNPSVLEVFPTSLKRLILLVYQILPFTPLQRLSRSLPKKVDSLVDIGCGEGEPLRFLRNRVLIRFAVGVDIHLPSILRALHRDTSHDEYIVAHASYLPFRNRSFSVCLMLATLEHLPKRQGLLALRECERVAMREIIVTTTVGYRPQPELDDNPWQIHRSGWCTEELEAFGFKVTGLYGHKSTWRHKEYVSKHKFRSLIISCIRLVTQIFIRTPRNSIQMMCVKEHHLGERP